VAEAVAVPCMPALALRTSAGAVAGRRRNGRDGPAESSDDAARGAAHGGAPATAAYRARAPHSLRFTQGTGMTPPRMCATDSAPAGPGLAPLPGPAPLVRPLCSPIGALRRRWPRSHPLHRRPPRRRSSSCPTRTRRQRPTSRPSPHCARRPTPNARTGSSATRSARGCPSGHARPAQRQRAQLSELAELVGLTASYLRGIRETANAWPGGRDIPRPHRAPRRLALTGSQCAGRPRRPPDAPRARAGGGGRRAQGQDRSPHPRRRPGGAVGPVRDHLDTLAADFEPAPAVPAVTSRKVSSSHTWTGVSWSSSTGDVPGQRIVRRTRTMANRTTYSSATKPKTTVARSRPRRISNTLRPPGDRRGATSYHLSPTPWSRTTRAPRPPALHHRGRLLTALHRP
jgi:hypothetical protein